MPVASPAHDYVDQTFDLQRELMPNPHATFPIRAIGSIPEAGIFDNDILLVDRSLSPWSGALVVVALGGKFLLRQWRMDTTKTAILVAAQAGLDAPDDAIRLADRPDLVLWGVVSVAIHTMPSTPNGGRAGRRGVGRCPRATAHPQLRYA